MKENLWRVLWVAVGSAIALTIALVVVREPETELLVASLGGSALFLFGLTTLPPAQPRSLFGGHLISSLIGVIAYQFFGDGLWVSIFAVVLTIGILLLTRTVHPPAGANPLIMIQSHAGFMDIWSGVMVGVLVLAITAYIWSRLGPGKVHYPISWKQPSPPTNNWSVWG